MSNHSVVVNGRRRALLRCEVEGGGHGPPRDFIETELKEKCVRVCVCV